VQEVHGVEVRDVLLVDTNKNEGRTIHGLCAGPGTLLLGLARKSFSNFNALPLPVAVSNVGIGIYKCLRAGANLH
jgi:hypothetical protein